MNKASHLFPDARPCFFVQGKSLANHSGFVLHFLLAKLFARGGSPLLGGFALLACLAVWLFPRRALSAAEAEISKANEGLQKLW